MAKVVKTFLHCNYDPRLVRESLILPNFRIIEAIPSGLANTLVYRRVGSDAIVLFGYNRYDNSSEISFKIDSDSEATANQVGGEIERIMETYCKRSALN